MPPFAYQALLRAEARTQEVAQQFLTQAAAAAADAACLALGAEAVLGFDTEAKPTFAKGEEMGWFQHGSTIIVFAPKGFALCEGISQGARIRMGQALLRLLG